MTRATTRSTARRAAVGVVASAALVVAGVPLAATAEAAVPRCTVSRLSGALGGSDGAAGTLYNTFVLRNVSSSACRLAGFPTLSRFSVGGQRQATRTVRDVAPTSVRTLTLAPGARASFVWAYSDVPVGTATSCTRTRVLGVALPGSSAALYLPVDVPRCSATLRTSAFRAGVITTP